MNRGGNANDLPGYTILEVLIVLAVTGLLFVSAALYIGGRQNITNFQLGSRAIVQKIQQVVNETESGYYPHTASFTCQPRDGSQNIRIDPGGSAAQGEAGDCIFVGKAIVFNPDSDTYNVYSLAGRRLHNNSDVSTPKEAGIVVIPNSVVAQQTPNGLEYVGYRVDGAASWTINGNLFPVAFLSNLSSDSGSSDGANGSQHLNLHGFSNSLGVNVESDIADEMGAAVSYPSRSQIDLCFNSAGTNQSAIVTITNGLRVSYQISNGHDCI